MSRLTSVMQVVVWCVLIRMDCYRVIMETIEYLLSTTHFNPQAPSVPKSPGPPPAHDTGRLTSAEAEHHVSLNFYADSPECLRDLLTMSCVILRTIICA